MAADPNDVAAKWARCERAFYLRVIERKSLRAVADELGVSHTQVATDVKTYKAFLATDRGGDSIEERRATIEAILGDVASKALDVYRGGTPKEQVAALNTIVATIGHIRAISGVDTPKEVKADVDTDYTIRWEDGSSDQAK